MNKKISHEDMTEIFSLALSKMPKDSRPVKYINLIYSDTFRIKEESFKLILDSGIYLSHEVFKKINGKERTELHSSAMTIFQMVMTKGVTILDLYNGIDYRNNIDNKIILNSYRDPFTMSLIVRNQLETFSNFNNIFLSTNRSDITNILHKFWILCGLKSRQRFIHNGMEKEQLEKGETEKLRIDALENEIKNDTLFISLSPKNQNHIWKVLGTNIFQFQFDGLEFKKSSWEHLFRSAGNDKLLKNIYSELSLKSHPSYVSMFQFAQSNSIEKYHSQASFYLDISRFIMAFMISDFIKYIPEAKEIFNKLPELNRALISSINQNLRDSKWLIFDDNVTYGNKINMEVLEFINQELDKLQ